MSSNTYRNALLSWSLWFIGVIAKQDYWLLFSSAISIAPSGTIKPSPEGEAELRTILGYLNTLPKLYGIFNNRVLAPMFVRQSSAVVITMSFGLSSTSPK